MTETADSVDELKAQALALLVDGVSISETAKKVGRTERTIQMWIKKSGWEEQVDAARSEADRRRAQKQRAIWAVRRPSEANAAGLEAALVRQRIHDLVPDVGRYRIQVLTEDSNGPKGLESSEKQTILPVVPAGDVKALATVYGILVDKAQLLSGDATARTETSEATGIDAEVRRLTEQHRRLDQPKADDASQ